MSRNVVKVDSPDTPARHEMFPFCDCKICSSSRSALFPTVLIWTRFFIYLEIGQIPNLMLLFYVLIDMLFVCFTCRSLFSLLPLYLPPFPATLWAPSARRWCQQCSSAPCYGSCSSSPCAFASSSFSPTTAGCSSSTARCPTPPKFGWSVLFHAACYYNLTVHFTVPQFCDVWYAA